LNPPQRQAAEPAPRITIASRDPNANVPGISLTRMVIAQCLAQLDKASPSDVAQHRWGNIDPQLVDVMRAMQATGGRRYAANEVAAGGGAGWGNELTIAQLYEADFITFLYSQIVMDRLPLQAVPEDVTVKGQDGAATGYWVGEGKAIPVSALDFSDVTLTNLKVAALAVITKELLRRSSPAAEILVRNALVTAAAQTYDGKAFSADAASAGVSPAGLYNGLAHVGSSAGTGVAGVRQDVAALINTFVAAKYDTTGLVWAMHPSLAVTLAMMTSDLDVPVFPRITAAGGEFFGYPVYTGHNLSASKLTLLSPQDIYRIDPKSGPGLDIQMSDQATIEMSSAPTGAALGSPPVAASAAPVSMFQSESVAIKVVRAINYAKRRAGAVQYIDSVAYSLIET
jgi:HK97 family phage major capsid protein